MVSPRHWREYWTSSRAITDALPGHTHDTLDAGSNGTNTVIDNPSGLDRQGTIRQPPSRSRSHNTTNSGEIEPVSELLALHLDEGKVYDIIGLLEEWHARETTVLHLLRRHVQRALHPDRNGTMREVEEQKRRMCGYIRGSRMFVLDSLTGLYCGQR